MSSFTFQPSTTQIPDEPKFLGGVWGTFLYEEGPPNLTALNVHFCLHQSEGVWIAHAWTTPRAHNFCASGMAKGSRACFQKSAPLF